MRHPPASFDYVTNPLISGSALPALKIFFLLQQLGLITEELDENV
ncbi:hypothetical protein [Arthrobacter sp. NIO-1057]|nr:hypothetical protein [Arthrobacter sp. NIO-1057]